MKIARHHLRESELTRYKPAQDWPPDCEVQWGPYSIDVNPVTKRTSKNYRRAFFEVFPTTPPTYLRGEGLTIAEAELKCFEQWGPIGRCSGHTVMAGPKLAHMLVCTKCGVEVNSCCFESFEDLKRAGLKIAVYQPPLVSPAQLEELVEAITSHAVVGDAFDDYRSCYCLYCAAGSSGDYTDLVHAADCVFLLAKSIEAKLDAKLTG